MILSDRDIRAALQRTENPLIIDPGFDPGRLQPASLELTLGPEFLYDMAGMDMELFDLRIKTHVSMLDDAVMLIPGDFMLATTVEKVHIPTDLVAQVNGKSSHARRGLVVHQTAGFIDPGFRGQITLELSNASRNPIKLTVGMPICQLVFTQLTSPAERPYGTAGLNSHYQGQRGVTPAAEV